MRVFRLNGASSAEDGSPSGSLSSFTPIAAGTKTILDGDYWIVNALNYTGDLNKSKVLDVSGNSGSDGANLQIYQKGTASYSTEAQVFHVAYNNGFYTITNKKTGKSLDVDNADNADKTNVKLYRKWGDGSNLAQKWRIDSTGGNEWFTIISACSNEGSPKCLDVSGGIGRDGDNVDIYHTNGTAAQKWKFIPYAVPTDRPVADGIYHIGSGASADKGLNAANAGTANGTNVNIYANLNDASQTWQLKSLGNGYYNIIHVKSGLVLDVDGAGQVPGTNVQLYKNVGQDNAQWILKSAGNGYFYIVSKSNGLYLDVKSGSKENSANVWVYGGNESSAQKWWFIAVSSASSAASTASPASSTVSTTGTSTTTTKVAVTGVKLSKSSLSLKAGKSSTLTATVTPSNAANKNVTWSTSNAKVARVVNGRVTAVAAGTAKITVTTTDGKKTATCTVTVR